jgi:hypothetical protein
MSDAPASKPIASLGLMPPFTAGLNGTEAVAMDSGPELWHDGDVSLAVPDQD